MGSDSQPSRSGTGARAGRAEARLDSAGEGGSLLKFAVLTFGCRANEADSCRVERDLGAAGGRPARPEEADLVVVNTCTVTAAADQAARQTIRRISRLNPAARIVATGCYATRRPEDLSALPGVAGLIPNSRKEQVGRLAAVEPANGRVIDDAPRPGMRGHTTYPLKVQTGCDERCSFCIVPATRGRSRSVALEDVLAQARTLAAAGFQEIVLTGVHLGAWGKDLAPARNVADLLAALEGLPGSTRFRLSSLEPMDCSSAVIETMVRSPRLQPHVHLPLQHASERLLQAMRRPYSLASYRAVVDRVRERLPDAAIGTDVIVGFPGETDSDAGDLESYLAASPITHLHVFRYSARPGTAAERLEPRVPAAVARERAGRIREIGRALRGRFEDSQAGRVREGLTLGDGSLVLTDNFLKVRVPPGRARNERVRLRLLPARPLRGEIVP